MSLFENIKRTWADILNVYRQMNYDKKLYKEYKRLLEDEFQKRDSEFVKIGLKLNEDGETLCYTFKIPEEFQTSGKDWMIYDKLNENTFFITEFLQKKAGFANYITSMPEFFHVEDPSTNDISLTYIAFWKFNPMIQGDLKTKAIIGLVSASVLSFAALSGLVWWLIL